MKLLPISGTQHPADVFTKALFPALFQKLLGKLSLIDIFQPQLEGGCKRKIVS